MPSSRPKILIQLIGAQAQPNAICIKAINPQIVVNIYTEKTEETVHHIEHFLKNHLSHIQFRSIKTHSVFPSVNETKLRFEKIFDALKDVENPEYIINYTGGTKPMSIGAFLAGRERGASLIYVESANAIREGENLAPCERWQPPQLSIEETLAIEGTSIEGSEEFSSLRIKMAHEILHLRGKERKDRALSQNRFCFYPASEERAFLKNTSSVNNYFQTVIDFGNNNAGIFNNIIALCQKEGWVTSELNVSESLLGNAKNLSSVNAFLDGGWWEILVAEAFKRLAPGDNTRWSVTAAGNVEDDVLSIIDGRLFLVSCKAGYDQKGFKSEFHRIADRARQLGGINAVPVFARYGYLTPEMKDYARQLKIPVIFPFMLNSSEKLKQELTQYLSKS